MQNNTGARNTAQEVVLKILSKRKLLFECLYMPVGGFDITEAKPCAFLNASGARNSKVMRHVPRRSAWEKRKDLGI
jgi:hypothetical protein